MVFADSPGSHSSDRTDAAAFAGRIAMENDRKHSCASRFDGDGYSSKGVSRGSMNYTNQALTFGKELDWESISNEKYRAACTKCIRELGKSYDIVPSSFFCQNVQREGSFPVGGGGFAVSWRLYLLAISSYDPRRISGRAQWETLQYASRSSGCLPPIRCEKSS